MGVTKRQTVLGCKQHIWMGAESNHPRPKISSTWILLCLEDLSRGQAIVGFDLSARATADVPKRSTKVRIHALKSSEAKRKEN